MAANGTVTVERMQTLVSRWEGELDARSIFLRCYLMMTRNMLAAIERQEFADCMWVDRLLSHFADYYFVALEAYERDPASAPAVWQLAHDATRYGKALAIQQLMLGVNAHINYDLVLATADLLKPEWEQLTEGQRGSRYRDYCHVNQVIAGTIDAVQDQVVEPSMPAMELMDRIFGSLDEKLISRLITGWRETVWEHTASLLETQTPDEREQLVRLIEQEALHRARLIGLTWHDNRNDADNN